MQMEGETSNAQSPNSEKKKRLRDISSNGDVLVNRGKPVSEKWKPVWIWLQSLNRTKIVDSAEVSAWLESNPTYATEMKQFHSHGVLVHYVQKCHQRLVHGRNCKGEGGKKVRFSNCFELSCIGLCFLGAYGEFCFECSHPLL